MKEGELSNYVENLRELAQNEVYLKHLQEDLAGRKLALTPDAGWEGKNEEQRKTAAEKAFFDDQACQNIKAGIRDAENRIAWFKAATAEFEAFRRDWEWTIRLRMVDALQGTTPSADNQQVETAAFDDLLQAQSELEVIEAVEQLGKAAEAEYAAETVDDLLAVIEAEKEENALHREDAGSAFEDVLAVKPDPDIQVYEGENFLNGLFSLADSAGDDIPF